MAFDPNANQDPQQVYAQLSPDQRAAIAQQFVSEYQQSGDPNAQQWANIDPNSVSPQQLAQMHEDAREHHPGILGRVMQHPVATAALGGFAIYEVDKHVRNREQGR